MNIVLFGLDNTAIIDYALILSKHLNLNFINASKAFSNYLMSNSLKNYNLEKVEQSFLDKLSRLKNVIIALPNDMFISNKNYKFFKKSLKIHIKFEKNDEILQSLDELLKQKSDFSFLSDTKTSKIVQTLKAKFR